MLRAETPADPARLGSESQRSPSPFTSDRAVKSRQYTAPQV
jgi:hypothetical protein